MGIDYTARATREWIERLPDVDPSVLHIGLRVRRLAGLLDERLADIAAAHGLANYGDYEVMAILRRSTVDVSAADLARQLRLSPAGLTGRLNRLEGLGLIERHTSPEDARQVHTCTTDARKERTDEIYQAGLDAQLELLDPLTQEQQDALGDMLALVTAEHDPPTGDPAPSLHEDA